MKKNFTKKATMFFVALAAFSMTANAQWKPNESLDNNLTAGLEIDTLYNDNDAGSRVNMHTKWLWHWDTNSKSDDPGKLGNSTSLEVANGEYVETRKTFPTRKGWFAVARRGDGNVAKAAMNEQLGKCKNYQGGGDLLYIQNVDVLRQYLNAVDIKYKGEANVMGDVRDSAAACAFVMPEGGCAMGVYPGKYRKTDVRVGIEASSYKFTSDIEFDMCTYNVGTSGKTMKYTMVVTLATSGGWLNIGNDNTTNYGMDKTDSIAVYGSDGVLIDGTRRFQIDNFFTSGSAAFTDKVHISVLDLLKTKDETFTLDDFTGKKILISIIGEAYDGGTKVTVPESGIFDPVVVIDNFTTTFWYTLTPPSTSLGSIKTSSTEVIGQVGQIEVLDAENDVIVYNVTGQKVATVASAQGSQFISIPAGVYLVKEKGQPTVKVLVK